MTRSGRGSGFKGVPWAWHQGGSAKWTHYFGLRRPGDSADILGAGCFTSMRRHPIQLALVLLGVLGFLLQSFSLGVPAGHRLCIGCDREWWTVGAHSDESTGSGCCETEHEADLPGDSTQPVAIGERECGCIDLPLMGGTVVIAAAPRVTSPNTLFSKAAPVAMEPLAMLVEWRRTAVRARAGPCLPPRLPTPLSQRTVLVL